MATNKPEIEQFIEAFNASATRTRTLLIGLLFASILAGIALVDSIPSWYNSRVEIYEVALQWFFFPEDKSDNEKDCTVLNVNCDSLKNGTVTIAKNVESDTENRDSGFHSVFDFAMALELKEDDTSKRWDSAQIITILDDAINLKYLPWFGKNKSDLPYWVILKPYNSLGTRTIPNKEQREALYKELSRAAAVFNGYSPHSAKEFESTLENLLEAQTENFTLVRLPILGVAFDINYLGVISGGIFYALMALLYLSMVREDRNLKTLFSRGWADKETNNRRLYELLSMYQVLTVPQKLYRPDNSRDMLTRKFIVGVFLFPCVVLLFVFVYDLTSFKIGLSLNPTMTIITSSLTFVSLAVIMYFSYKLIDRQTRINRLWDNQYFRLHLDNFLSSEVQVAESSPFATIDQAKVNWANAAFAIRSRKQMGEKECVKRFRKFLNLCYDKLEDVRNPKITEAQESAYWEKLAVWYKQYQTHSTRKQFRREMTIMMNNLNSLDTDQ